MSFSNLACQACKRRRIKCDGTKPACKNCQKSQRICLDATAVKQTNFSIHVENDFASGKSKRPRGPRSVLGTTRPQDDLKTRALTYYLNTHTQSLADSQPYAPGCLSGSITFWRHSGKSSAMVDVALSAVGLAVYARTHQQPAAAEEGAQIYYQLLRMMQDRIGDLSEIDDFDAWLLTVRLMGRYEGTIHSPGDFQLVEPFSQLRNWAHHDGAQAVLKLWNDSVTSGTATYIITEARKGLIRISFLRSLPLPCWMLDGARFGEDGLGLEYDRVEVRLANLRHVTACLEREDNPDLAKINELLMEAQELDQELQDWAAQIPRKYSYKVYSLQGDSHWPRAHFYSPRVYSFSKAGYAAPWLQYFFTRMFVISTRLRLLALSHSRSLDETYEKDKKDSNAILKMMADSIASTVPFVLGRFKVENPYMTPVLANEKEEIKPCQAMIIVWPLSVVSGLKGVDEEQQPWFRSELARLGRILGDGVIESAESGNWITF